MFLFFIFGTLLQIPHGQTASGIVLHAVSACYGDSSRQGANRLEISCSEGRIYVESIRVALKPAVLGCPAVEHNLTPADPETCCTLNATADCVNPYRGYSQLDFFRDCNGRVSCSKPVVWDVLTCPDPAPFPTPTVSNFMVLEYYCQTEGVYNSSCSDVVDCRYAHPECRSQRCQCESGYTYVGNECKRDGDLDGVCLTGSTGSGCLDSNAECSFGSICACKIGYAEQAGTCINSIEALYRDEACYGALDANHIRLNCTTGYIRIDRLRIAAKPLIAKCPDFNADSVECCNSDAFKDCVNEYTGDSVASFHECNGFQTCTKPVVRQQLQCTEPSYYPQSSTYMIVDYHCLAKGQNFGICNTTGDCTDPAATCEKSRCHCVEGYTASHYFDACWQDGFPNGNCELHSVTPCFLNGTLCDHGSRKCVCGNNFLAQNNDMCDAENSYKMRCNTSADCQGDKMVCDEGRCDCMPHFIYSNGQCVSDNDYNMSCNATMECRGDNIVCQDGRCTCTPNHTYRDNYCSPEYNRSCAVTEECQGLHLVCRDGHCLCAPGHSYIQAVCRHDGLLGGRCNSSLACVDANTTCNNDTQTCECEPMYSEFEHRCYKDNHLHGYCFNSTACVVLHTICTDNTCQCIDGFSGVNGQCIKDGEYGGQCRLPADCDFQHAICVDNRCLCQRGYTYIDGTCLPNGSNGAPCLNNTSSDTCLDRNAVCTGGYCVCVSQFQTVHGVCRHDQHLGGRCNSTNPCLDIYTNCSDGGICECVSGYQGVNGTCVQVGSSGGACFPNGTCTDVNAACVADDMVLCLASVCQPGICQCRAGTALTSAGLCVEHGSNGGLCNGTIACRDENAVCTDGLCTCKAAFQDIDGVCKQDQHLGGRCNSTNPCLDAYTNCSDGGICECLPRYHGVNGTCFQVGDVGGLCTPAGSCWDGNARCVKDGQLLCDGSACQPGICECRQNWRLGPGGTCAQDCTAGLCMTNAVCNNSTHLCECPLPFTAVYTECIGSGDVGGRCANVLGGGLPCLDQHAVCVNNTCRCNEERNYVLRDKQCKKNDTYVTGRCGSERTCKDGNTTCLDGYCVCKPGTIVVNGICSNGFDIPGVCNTSSGSSCSSPSTVCIAGRCVCQSGFVPLLGQCKPGNSSIVSTCPGDSAYNTLAPECPERMRAVVTGDVLTVVRKEPTCPAAMDTYERAQFERCCSVHGEDCVLGTTGCTSTNGNPTYSVQDYVCVDDDQAISPGDNRTVTGQPVFIVPPTVGGGGGGGESGGGGGGGSGNGTGAELCAIRASCLTDIAVYAIYIQQNASGACVPTLVFNSVPVQCPYTNPVFSSSEGFCTIALTNPAQGGQYSFKVEEAHQQAQVTVACGNAASTLSGPPSIVCGATSPPSSSPATTLKQESSNNSTTLAVAVPVCIVLLAALVAVILFRFKDKIRNRFCPVEKIPDLHDPTPAKTKFPGRDEGGHSTPKTDPDSAPRPPARLPPLGPASATPSNKRFRRGATLVEFITSQEKYNLKKTNMADKLIVTLDDKLDSPNVDTGKPQKKKKGRKKILNAATHVINAAKNMRSNVTQTTIIQETGTFTPNENFYTYSAPNGGPQKHIGMRGHVDLPMGIESATASYHSDGTRVPPPAPRGQLPPIRAPPVEGLPPQDFMEAEALPASLRLPSRQSLLSNGTSNGSAWAQVLASSVGRNFLARSQQGQPQAHASERHVTDSFRLLNLPGQSPLNSVYSRHSGEQDPTAQSPKPRRTIRRPSQLDIQTLTDE